MDSIEEDEGHCITHKCKDDKSQRKHVRSVHVNKERPKNYEPVEGGQENEEEGQGTQKNKNVETPSSEESLQPSKQLTVSSKLMNEEKAALLQRLMLRYYNSEIATALQAEKMVEQEFSEKEQEVLLNCIQSANLDMPYQIKQRIHQAIQKIKARKKSLKMQKNYALSDPVRFCKIFYHTPHAEPFQYEKVAKRTSRSLLTEEQASLCKARQIRRLEHSLQNSGYDAPMSEPYREFGKVQIDPRDILIDSVDKGLTKVAMKNYNLQKKKEKIGWFSPPIKEKPLGRKGVKVNVNTMRRNTFYYKCGYDLINSYVKEGNRRIVAVSNGESYEDNWTYYEQKKQDIENKKAANVERPWQLLPSLVTDHENEQAVTDEGSMLEKYRAELNQYCERLEKPYLLKKFENTRQSLAEKLLVKFKEKLEYLYMIICMLKNLRLFHIKMKRLPMATIWELRSDIKRVRTPSARNINLYDSPSATDSRNPYTLHYITSGKRISHQMKSSVGSASSAVTPQQNDSRQYYPIYLESWEDFLSVNPREKKHRRRMNDINSRPSGGKNAKKPESFGTVKKPRKPISFYWKLVRKHFLTSKADQVVRAFLDEAEEMKWRLSSIAGEDTLNVQTSKPGSMSTEGKMDMYDPLTKIKIEWLRQKITSTSRVQKTLLDKYRHTIQSYREKRNKKIEEKEIAAWPNRAYKRKEFPVYKKGAKKRIVKIQKQEELWFELLQVELECYKNLQPGGHRADELKRLLGKLFRFSTDASLTRITHPLEKIRLLCMSMPAFEILSLPMQVAFKFTLGNILSLNPNLFEEWMAERLLPVHVELHKEPIVPEAKINEIKAETDAVNKELQKAFQEV